MRFYRAGIFFAMLVFVPGVAWGSLVIASGAGALLPGAEDLSGVNVTEIQGSLTTDPTSVSLFEIDILNALDFSALTVDAGPFGIPDTELFLFDSSGAGVYFNDDIGGGDTLSCLPSADSANPCPVLAPGLGPVTAGIYYLGIVRSADGPLDGVPNEIFSNLLSSDIVGPNSGVGPLAGWDNGAYTQPNYDLRNYDIILTGTTPAAPEPATWILTAAALLAAGSLRGKLLRR
jgi:hypothetical protein